MQILELTLKCSDIAGTEAFYSELLSTEPIRKTAMEVSFNAGESQLNFQYAENLKPVYHFAFDIPVNLLSDALIWVSSFATIIPASKNEIVADFKNWNARSFYFFDNNKNILEFICRYDRNINSTGPFSGRQIINISEVAVASNDVAGLVATLGQKFSLTNYEKQPPLENFAALGDVYGLLILSRLGRAWFPTDIPAEKFPVHLVFELQGKKFMYVEN